MPIMVDTKQYQRTHGKLPRGTGLWGFTFGTRGQGQIFWHNGTYGEAVKAAKAQAKANHISIVEVCD